VLSKRSFSIAFSEEPYDDDFAFSPFRVSCFFAVLKFAKLHFTVEFRCSRTSLNLTLLMAPKYFKLEVKLLQTDYAVYPNSTRF